MTKANLLKALQAVPGEAEITIGKCLIVDEEKHLKAILELPVEGFGYDANNNELHFLLDLANVKESFLPSDVTFLSDIPPAEHDFHNPDIQESV
jgi:hypothetical protein